MCNIKKKFHNLNLINFIKSDQFFFYLAVTDSNDVLFKKTKNLINIKIRCNKKTKNLLTNSIAFFFKALIINSTIFLKIQPLFLIDFDYINQSLSKLLIAVSLNNKIYSKFCFLKFLNSYDYFQNKKLVYKLLVLKMKSINNNKYLVGIKNIQTNNSVATTLCRNNI